MNGNNLITKTNYLVSKSAYNISHLEQLIFLSALSEVDSRKEISDNHLYSLNLSKLSKTAGIDTARGYGNFKKALERLFLRKISIPKDDGSTLVTGFIQSYEYHDGKASLSLRFSTDIIPYISEIRESFVCYKFKQIARFKSSYSARLYELLIQRLDLTNEREISITQIKSMFKLGKSYDRYNNLKQRVIIPAIKDINEHSDINVIYQEITEKRKVIGLKFHIEALEPRPKTKKQLTQEALPGETYDEVKERLKEKKEPRTTPFWKNIFK